MALIDKLRPVEALFLLDYAGNESMYERETLTAALVYLKVKGYIEVKDGELGLTGKGSKPTSNLREYEKGLLECIADDCQEDLKDVMVDYDFGESLAEKGYFRIETRRRGFWIFSWTQTKYVPTEKFGQAVGELEELKDKITSAIENETPLTKKQVAMAYAFPSLAKGEDFKDYAVSVDDEITDLLVATEVTGLTDILPGI